MHRDDFLHSWQVAQYDKDSFAAWVNVTNDWKTAIHATGDTPETVERIDPIGPSVSCVLCLQASGGMTVGTMTRTALSKPLNGGFKSLPQFSHADLAYNGQSNDESNAVW